MSVTEDTIQITISAPSSSNTLVLTSPVVKNQIVVSHNDITSDERAKLSGIEAGATADQAITAGDGLSGGGTGDVSVAVDSTVVRTSGSQVIAGTKVFTGGVNILGGGLNVVAGNSALKNVDIDGDIEQSGGSQAILKNVQANSLTFKGAGTSVIGTTNQGNPALDTDDLEIRSNGNVVVKLDYDDDNVPTNPSFIVQNNVGVDKLSVSETGVLKINDVYTFPTSDGASGQVLTTDGSGAVTFQPTSQLALGTTSTTALAGNSAINDLSDVDVNYPQVAFTGSPGNMLSWDPDNSKWRFFSEVVTSSPSPVAGFTNVEFANSSLNPISLSNIGFNGGTNALSINTNVSPTGTNLFVDGAVRFNGAIQVGSGSAVTYALPTADGSANEVLTTDGSGLVTFQPTLQIGTTSTTALAGDTTTISGSQASAITANTAKISYTDASAVAANTAKVSYTDAAVDSRIGAASIDALSDVDTTTAAPTTGQALVWDGSQWEPGTVSGGGSSPWTTAGNDLYYNTGNVGIGTTSPSTALDVAGQINAVSGSFPVLGFTRETTATGGAFTGFTGIASAMQLATKTSGDMTDGFGGGIVFSLNDATQTSASNYVARIYARRDGADNAGALQIFTGTTGSTAALTARASGDVGIGTTTPAAKLDVEGNVRFLLGSQSPTYALNITGVGSNTHSIGGGNSLSLGYAILNHTGSQNLASGGANKYISIGGSVSGSGSRLYVKGSTSDDTAKAFNVFDSSSSELFVVRNDGNVGIGTATPSQPLHVVGDMKVDGGYIDFREAGGGLVHIQTSAGNSALSIGSLTNPSVRQVAIGHILTSKASSVQIGGRDVGGGTSSVAIGDSAMENNTNSSNNIAIGQSTHRFKNGSNTVAIGNGAMYGQGASGTGDQSVAIGSSANSHSGDNVVAVGYTAGRNSTGNNNVSVGHSAGLGVDGTSTFSNTVAVGYQALTALTTGAGNTAVGNQAGLALTTGAFNTAVGSEAAKATTDGIRNTFLGFQAQRIQNASYNTGVGFKVMYDTSGNHNTAMGYNAFNAAGGKSHGVAIGSQAAQSATNPTGVVAIGSQALTALTTGSSNTAVGYQAGSAVTTGSANVFVGYSAGSAETGSNKLYIENSNSTTPLIYGEFDNDILRVNGTLQVGDPAGTGYALPAATGTTGQILSVNASGDLAFAAAGGGGSGGIGTADQTLDADRTIDTNGFNLDIELDPTGTADTFTIHDGTHDLFQVDTTTTGTLFSVNDVSGLPLLEVDEDQGVIMPSIKVEDGGLSSAGSYGKGSEVWYQGTSTPTAGDVYYLDSSGNWAATDADAVATSKGMLAVAAGTDSDVNGMVIKGFVYLATDSGGSVGDPVYLHTTTGKLTNDVSGYTTGDVVRIAGYKVATNIVYFNPSNDFIVLA